ncbi:hypothetical protein UCD39_18105 [Nitrospirillum sp. BR 11752]|uniref:hypothetical protein n=1 Tax=Nitrospirillum sp. BR 11752 TaxID=3104293 RepID=UPI002EBCF129|nr:hypothetical protein [Nitrospirillum sp. BR 11752]
MTTGVGDNGAGQDATDLIGRLSQISSRTSLMAIDSVLRALSHPAVARATSGLATGEGRAASSAAVANDAADVLSTPTVADVAREVGVIARRMVTTTEDFAATMKTRSA